MLPNYYQVLDIEQNASEYDIRHSFRSKLKQLHPEFNPSPNGAEQFIMIHEAYEILIHKNTRALYDEDLSTGKNPANQAICAHFIEIAQRIAKENLKRSFVEMSKTHFYKDTATLDISVSWLMFLSGFIVISIPSIFFQYFEQSKQPAVGFIIGIVGVLAGMVLLAQGYLGIKAYSKAKKKI